jgi:acyl carrier protein
MQDLQVEANTIEEILWLSLAGGNYDLEALKEKTEPDTRFDELGLDSLDVIDFFIRVQDHYKVTMRDEDYSNLASIEAVRAFVREKSCPPA